MPSFISKSSRPFSMLRASLSPERHRRVRRGVYDGDGEDDERFPRFRAEADARTPSPRRPPIPAPSSPPSREIDRFVQDISFPVIHPGSPRFPSRYADDASSCGNSVYSYGSRVISRRALRKRMEYDHRDEDTSRTSYASSEVRSATSVPVDPFRIRQNRGRRSSSVQSAQSCPPVPKVVVEERPMRRRDRRAQHIREDFEFNRRSHAIEGGINVGDYNEDGDDDSLDERLRRQDRRKHTREDFAFDRRSHAIEVGINVDDYNEDDCGDSLDERLRRQDRRKVYYDDEEDTDEGPTFTFGDIQDEVASFQKMALPSQDRDRKERLRAFISKIDRGYEETRTSNLTEQLRRMQKKKSTGEEYLQSRLSPPMLRCPETLRHTTRRLMEPTVDSLYGNEVPHKEALDGKEKGAFDDDGDRRPTVDSFLGEMLHASRDVSSVDADAREDPREASDLLEDSESVRRNFTTFEESGSFLLEHQHGRNFDSFSADNTLLPPAVQKDGEGTSYGRCIQNSSQDDKNNTAHDDTLQDIPHRKRLVTFRENHESIVWDALNTKPHSPTPSKEEKKEDENKDKDEDEETVTSEGPAHDENADRDSVQDSQSITSLPDLKPRKHLVDYGSESFVVEPLEVKDPPRLPDADPTPPPTVTAREGDAYYPDILTSLGGGSVSFLSLVASAERGSASFLDLVPTVFSKEGSAAEETSLSALLPERLRDFAFEAVAAQIMSGGDVGKAPGDGVLDAATQDNQEFSFIKEDQVQISLDSTPSDYTSMQDSLASAQDTLVSGQDSCASVQDSHIYNSIPEDLLDSYKKLMNFK